MAFCSGCGASMPDNAAFCASCGRSNAAGAGAGAAAAPAPAPAPVASAGLSDTAAGAIAYITFIPALIFLLIEPYNRKKFVRFHSFQCIFLCVASFAVHMVVTIASSFFGILGVFGGLGLHSLVSLAFFILWIMCLIKASQGQMWEVPGIGPFARQQAGS